MRDKVPADLERRRMDVRQAGYGHYPGTWVGAFCVPVGPAWLYLIASDGSEWADSGLPGEPWEHVSVSVRGEKRCPTWDEMCAVKRLFWDDEECVVQFHPPLSEYVNHHPYTLHLWKPVGVNLPTPPAECVGPTGGKR